ncbi:hypothetical protein M422DRAFT_33975 [Sphaerobolus stellatus SS14]|uniref:Uncharacterized protein n=1 Tax=Sphaerobolus stellatus (strain SS14) TaxID=990650 RepID=A0A0C9U2C5_SPHS4|nr:hypothetical protein M422DRAFT_33975 [Sphaerobolus stellatus SS14]
MLSRAPRTTIRGISLRQIRPRPQARFQSTTSSTAPPPNTQALYGGIVGGSAVLVGTYAWYHLSGTKKVVETAKSTIETAQQAKQKIQEATPSPTEALNLLRSATKTFAPFPGVDKVFDELEKTADKHGERIAKIATTMYNDVAEALSSGDPKQVGERVLKAIQKSASEVQSLTSDVGSDVFGPMLEKSPELKRVLGTSYDHMKGMADKYGPEAQRIASDTANQASKILSQGVNAASLKDVSNLIQQKSKEIQELASKTSSDAWEAARDSAQPLLDRLPDLKKLIDDNVESLKGYVGEERVDIVKDLYQKLEDISKSGKPANEMKQEAEKVVKEKVDQLRKQGGIPDSVPDLSNFDWSTLGLDKLKMIPGIGGIADQVPKLQELQSIAEKRGPEAKKLLDETYTDIKKVLDQKVEAAKKLGEEAKEDANKKTQKQS